MAYLRSSICLIFVLLCVNFDPAKCDCSALDQYFYIRNKVSGLVLDAGDYRGVKVQTFNATKVFQRFQLQPASRTGLFNIYSLDSPKVLTYFPTGQFLNDGNLTIDYLGGSHYQQWFLNGDGTIMNAGFYKYGLTVDQSPWDTGSYVVVADARNFGPEQTFELTNARFPSPV